MAARKNERKLSRRYAFVKRRLLRLPQEPHGIEVDFCPLPDIVEDEYGFWLGLVVDQDTGFILATGCCLFLGTGLLLGIPFHLILSRYFSRSSKKTRIVVATAMAIAVWLITFYGLIDWLQPQLFGGRWIVEQIPIAVAVLTHLVFGWTILLLGQFAQFVPRARSAWEASR